MSIDNLVDSCLSKHYAAEQQAQVAGLGASVLLGRDLTRAKVLLSSPDREKWGEWLRDLEPRGIKISPRTAAKKLKLWKHYGRYPRLWQVRAKQSEMIKLGARSTSCSRRILKRPSSGKLHRRSRRRPHRLRPQPPRQLTPFLPD